MTVTYCENTVKAETGSTIYTDTVHYSLASTVTNSADDTKGWLKHNFIFKSVQDEFVKHDAPSRAAQAHM